MSHPRRCQELVIGSGPGGAVTAALLAEQGRDVVIVEEGHAALLESCEPFSVDEMRQKYRAGGLNPAMGKPRIPFVEGRCGGGGSEINSGLYHRTPEQILDRWRGDYKVNHLTAETMEEHFRYCEDALSVCLTPGQTPSASRKLAEGAAALGWRAMEVPRWFRYDGRFGIDGCPLGVRQSMTKTFLPRASAAGARLFDETRAERLTRRRGKWSVTLQHRSETLEVAADHVFVCGGAVQTPALLIRSGMTRNIGNTLAMHPTVKVMARFPEQVNHDQLGVPVHQVKEFSPRISFGCSISSLPYLMLSTVDYPSRRAFVRDQWRHMAIYYAMITGPAVGRVRHLGPDAMVRYQLDNADFRDLSLGLYRLCRLLFAAGATELYPSISGMQPLRGIDDLSRLPAVLPAERVSLMTIHLFSSCPMGEDLARCATDSFGRVHGESALSIHDASLLCTAPGVNPQGTIMALAHRNTQRYLEGCH